MSLRQTPFHHRPAPQRHGEHPYRALLLEPDGRTQLLSIERDEQIEELFGGRALRLLPLEMLGAMLVVDRDEEDGLLPNLRATAAARAVWTSMRGNLLGPSPDAPTSTIRGAALFVGFIYTAVPLWYRRQSESGTGLDDIEVLSLEFLIADPQRWIELNELPF